ncbi:permease-like cell division protein FtsX [Patescibacteria group bacterium]|nr:permease-like cell division protein FtsX [Patescibacteria group bacterium]MBU1448388.1 permease-like cell division protein FtsX [Patescibacteria group bacterium]MBU2613236.1 permease-like cell division protein FtsX [Patescibacteria group bacterium]
MSIAITSGRIVSYAWKNFARNAWIGLATVFVLVLALLSVNVLVGVSAMLDRAVTILEDKIDISVYFKNDTPEAVLQQAQFFMAGLPQVREVSLLNSDQALDAFKERHANDPRIMEALAELDQNPLGASLVIRGRKPDDYPFLLEALKNPQFGSAIESKTYDDHAEAIRQVRDIGASARLFGAILIAIFALFSAMIVYNAIRVAIYTQREEIGVMRLVGASSSFVRMPFVVEGLFIAALALVLTAGVVAATIAFLEPRLIPFFDGSDPGLRLFFYGRFWYLLAAEGGTLVVLVTISSWAAVGKYLKR